MGEYNMILKSSLCDWGQGIYGPIVSQSSRKFPGEPGFQ